MGVIICEKHGRSPIIHTCSHVRYSLESGERPDTNTQIDLSEEGTSFGPRFICDKCSSKIGTAPERIYELDTAEGELVYNTATFAWCKKCFAEASS